MVYEFGQVNGQPYFIMEYVDGLNLRQLEQEGKLAPREALQDRAADLRGAAIRA